jgi:hypothetical protein
MPGDGILYRSLTFAVHAIIAPNARKPGRIRVGEVPVFGIMAAVLMIMRTSRKDGTHNVEISGWMDDLRDVLSRILACMS